MNSIFESFTISEVESIRSVVLIGQQSNDMLLSNCSIRSLPEIKSFIKKFLKKLLDSNISSNEIVNLANQQYLSILNGSRSRKFFTNSLPSTQSVMSFTHYLPSIDSLPLKFRVKFAKNENESNISKPIPTRSKSVSTGLNLTHNESNIQIIPPIDCNLIVSCKKMEDLIPGNLAAIIKSKNGNTILCRILGGKYINEIPHALVSFFNSENLPCYIRLHQIVLLKNNQKNFEINNNNNNNINVDLILYQILSDAQSFVFLNNQNFINEEKKINNNKLIQTIACAAQLQLLNFVSNWEIPIEKINKMFESLTKIYRIQFKSTEEINQRCMLLIKNILKN